MLGGKGFVRIGSRVAAAALGLAAALGVAGAAAQPEPRAATAAAPRWNAIGGEEEAALARTGDPVRGREVYALCAPCHLANGAGRPDGTFPQLAGQHATVLIKQLADIRAGRRDNPIMQPFAEKLIDAQELADVAAYLASLPIPGDNGRGPGTDLARGRALYERDCARCHGEQGQGDAARFYPVVAGQHYEYALRQLRDIAAGRRRNANPDMVRVVAPYRDADLQAVADYVSRLEGAAHPAAKGR
jgi:cytochrome c553